MPIPHVFYAENQFLFNKNELFESNKLCWHATMQQYRRERKKSILLMIFGEIYCKFDWIQLIVMIIRFWCEYENNINGRGIHTMLLLLLCFVCSTFYNTISYFIDFNIHLAVFFRYCW